MPATPRLPRHSREIGHREAYTNAIKTVEGLVAVRSERELLAWLPGIRRLMLGCRRCHEAGANFLWYYINTAKPRSIHHLTPGSISASRLDVPLSGLQSSHSTSLINIVDFRHSLID